MGKKLEQTLQTCSRRTTANTPARNIPNLFKLQTASRGSMAGNKMARTQGEEDDYSEDSHSAAKDGGRGYKQTNLPLTYAVMSGFAADIKSTFSAAIADLKSNLLILTEKLAAIETMGKYRDRRLLRLESVAISHSSYLIEVNRHLEDLDNRGRRNNIKVTQPGSSLLCRECLTVCWKDRRTQKSNS